MCHGAMIEDAMRRARKEHRCDECGAAIRPGHVYRRQRSIQDGEPSTWRGCEECAVVLEASAMANDYYDDCRYVGEAHDYKHETARNIGWRKWRAVMRAAEAKVRAMLKPRSRAPKEGA